MPLLDNLDRRREEAQRHRENSGRLCQAYANFESTGLGSFEFEDRIDFTVIFTEKPYVSYAAVVDTNGVKDLVGRVALPQTTGYVTEWDTDEKELYTGCWVAVRIDFPVFEMIDYETGVVVDHHFTFTGVAIKDVPPELGV